MKQVEFLELECVGIQIMTDRIIGKSDVFTYTASNQEFGRRMANGHFKLITEDEIAKEYLENGKGVSYKGFVYFQADKIENSQYFRKLKNKQERFEKELNRKINEEYQTYLNGALYEVICDITHFPMVKSMIQLYQSDVFSLERLESKLQVYLKPEGVQIVLNELHQSVEKAG